LDIGRLADANPRALVAWTPAVLVAIWALMRLFGIEGGYPLVAVIAYTPIVTAVALLATVLALALRQWRPAALAGVAALVLVVLVAPRAIGGPDQIEGRHLRVMTANLFVGRADPQALLNLLKEKQVDVLALQEMTPDFQLRFEQLAAQQLPPPDALFAPAGPVANGVYSRFPPKTVGSEVYITPAPGLTLAVLSAHPPIPGPGGTTEKWRTELRAMPSATGSPLRLLIGDFNSTLDHEEFRELVDRGYADAAEQMGDGLTPTWPAIRRGLRYLPVTIDHVLYDRDRIGVIDYEVHGLPGSDHRAVYAELVIREP
jgi:endonuclease/exonuclease/phosphatase (EEP) superfamily protein YafD